MSPCLGTTPITVRFRPPNSSSIWFVVFTYGCAGGANRLGFASICNVPNLEARKTVISRMTVTTVRRWVTIQRANGRNIRDSGRSIGGSRELYSDYYKNQRAESRSQPFG